MNNYYDIKRVVKLYMVLDDGTEVSHDFKEEGIFAYYKILRNYQMKGPKTISKWDEHTLRFSNNKKDMP